MRGSGTAVLSSWSGTCNASHLVPRLFRSLDQTGGALWIVTHHPRRPPPPAKPDIGEPIIILAFAATNEVIAVRCVGPGQRQLHLAGDRIEVGRPFDRIGDGREKDLGVALFDMLDCGRNILHLLTLVAPHQEHADADSVLLREFNGPANLLDADTALHRVQYPLAAALGA